MKYFYKLILLTSILIFVVNNGSAQLTVGGQAGLNIASLNGHKTYDESSPRFGGSAFVLVDIPIDKGGFMSIETGAGISQMGMRHRSFSQDLAIDRETKIKNILDYVVVPLYLKENFSSIYTKFGVYTAYLLNAQSKVTVIETTSGVSKPPVTSNDEEFKENASDYDYGFSFGFGFVKHLKSKHFRRRGGKRVLPIMKIDFKYDIGVAPISKDKDAVMNLRNRAFMIGITFSTVPK